MTREQISENILTTEEVCLALSRSRPTIKRLTEEGTLKPIRKTRIVTLYWKPDVEAIKETLEGVNESR